jgi:hypothetical protein
MERPVCQRAPLALHRREDLNLALNHGSCEIRHASVGSGLQRRVPPRCRCWSSHSLRRSVPALSVSGRALSLRGSPDRGCNKSQPARPLRLGAARAWPRRGQRAPWPAPPSREEVRLSRVLALSVRCSYEVKLQVLRTRGLRLGERRRGKMMCARLGCLELLSELLSHVQSRQSRPVSESQPSGGLERSRGAYLHSTLSHAGRERGGAQPSRRAAARLPPTSVLSLACATTDPSRRFGLVAYSSLTMPRASGRDRA